MHNILYSLLIENTGQTLSIEQLQLFEDQNLEFFILSKDYNYPISFSDKSNLIMKRQIEFEILKAEAMVIAEKFDSYNIDYRLLKGLCVALTYPKPYTRTMADFDILVKPDMFSYASRALIEIGYSQEYRDPYSKDVSFVKVGAPHIELHRNLFEVSHQNFFVGYEKLLDLLWKSEFQITINDYEIKVPEPLEHFKFLMIHFFKHFRSNGCGVRFLLDIYYFREFHKIDFLEVKSYYSSGIMNKFVDLIENMLLYYFGIENNLNKHMNESDLNDVQIAGNYLFADGIYGKSSINSDQTNRYSLYKRAFIKSKLLMFQMILFPNKNLLDYRFLYAKKYPYLLPFAWIHRFLGFVFGKRPIKEKLFFLHKNDEVLKCKEAILKQLGFY